MFKKKHIHFIGIGGIGMSGIAQVLHKKGFKVSGSDLSENVIVKKLRKKIKVFRNYKSYLDTKIRKKLMRRSSAILRRDKLKDRRVQIYSPSQILWVGPTSTCYSGSQNDVCLANFWANCLNHHF